MCPIITMPMSRQSLYESAFEVAGVDVYHYEIYEDPDLDSQADVLIHLAADNGLCTENANPHDLITRGEAAFVIYKLAQGVKSTPTPPIMSELEIQNKVDYEAPFDVNDSFATVFEAFAGVQEE